MVVSDSLQGFVNVFGVVLSKAAVA